MFEGIATAGQKHSLRIPVQLETLLACVVY